MHMIGDFWETETYVKQASDDYIWASPENYAVDGSIWDYVPFKLNSANLILYMFWTVGR